ncbi:MAG: hypothetical protein HOJ74_17410, partial [Gemmatimonadales bacterium]|nr:hypothetical protein [Gemmatimonadales bacterium]
MKFATRLLARHIGTMSALLIAFTLSAAQDASAQPAPEFDLTGEWVFNVESPNGLGERQVTFVQEGNKLTGEISSSMASGDLEGTIEGDQVFFVASIFMDAGAFAVTYKATYLDGQLRNGTIDFGDYGGG